MRCSAAGATGSQQLSAADPGRPGGLPCSAAINTSSLRAGQAPAHCFSLPCRISLPQVTSGGQRHQPARHGHCPAGRSGRLRRQRRAAGAGGVGGVDRQGGARHRGCCRGRGEKQVSVEERCIPVLQLHSNCSLRCSRGLRPRPRHCPAGLVNALLACPALQRPGPCCVAPARRAGCTWWAAASTSQT